MADWTPAWKVEELRTVLEAVEANKTNATNQQENRGNVRRYPDGWGEAAPLTGLLYCADCGGKMYVHRTNNGKRISQYPAIGLIY